MKKIYINIVELLMIVFAFSACSPDDVTSLSKDGLPILSSISDINISVNQETNEVTFSIDSVAGFLPFWTVEKNNHKGEVYSTQNSFSDIYANAGTYSVEFKLSNSNGISDGAITKEFVVENSIVDFDAYIAKMSGKEWRIANDEAGHISCGESGTDGTGWWSASANEKSDVGLYDDRLTFGQDMSYTYNPGEGGTVYMNAGCTALGVSPDGEDFMVNVDEKTSEYKFEVDGDDIYLVLDAQALFPYIASDGLYESPRYKITSISPSKIELLSDDGSIAWHYTLTSGEAAKPAGYDSDSDFNMWKTATINNTFYYAPDWSQIDDPELELDGNSYILTLPTATSDQWQAQCLFNTDLSATAGVNYDFRCTLNSSKDLSKVTIKLVQTNGTDGTDNSGNFFFAENVSLTAYEDYVFKMPAAVLEDDADNISLVFDFGGNPENTIITVSDVCLQKSESAE